MCLHDHNSKFHFMFHCENGNVPYESVPTVMNKVTSDLLRVRLYKLVSHVTLLFSLYSEQMLGL